MSGDQLREEHGFKAAQEPSVRLAAFVPGYLRRQRTSLQRGCPFGARRSAPVVQPDAPRAQTSRVRSHKQQCFRARPLCRFQSLRRPCGTRQHRHHHLREARPFPVEMVACGSRSIRIFRSSYDLPPSQPTGQQLFVFCELCHARQRFPKSTLRRSRMPNPLQLALSSARRSRRAS